MIHTLASAQTCITAFFFLPCFLLLDIVVKLIFVLFFMIPGNNDELTPFVMCVVLYDSQLRVRVLDFLFAMHAIELYSILCVKPENYKF
jgi:hypothetical protein